MKHLISKTEFNKPYSDEWIDTNGLGGFASSTSAMIHTRRYHGLLCAAVIPASVRTMLVSGLADFYGETRITPCMTGKDVYEGICESVIRFEHVPYPRWNVKCGDMEYEKSVMMPEGFNTVIVRYIIRSGDSERLKIYPELVHRDYHMMYSTENLDVSVACQRKNGFSADWYESGVVLSAEISAGSFEKQFYKRPAYYAIEDERGFDPYEEVFAPGYFRPVAGCRDFCIVFTIHEPESVNCYKSLEKELSRRETLMGTADVTEKMLRFSADQFFFRRDDGHLSVLAGYPWFTDWGRDTMISLDGLSLCTGWYDKCRKVLEAFSHYVSCGMIPNRFPDRSNDPEYNTIDATLWYFEAFWRYFTATDDTELLKILYPVFEDIIQNHINGTRFNIHMDEDFLLYGGSEGWQLTWMDAKFEDTVFTPRHGKCVEINALWFNALKIMKQMSTVLKLDDSRYDQIAENIRQSMAGFITNAGYCADYINEHEINTQLRPNQLFAFSLSNQVFDREQAVKIFENCCNSLYTPLGIRSLSPDDPQYCPYYRGDHFTRDSQYHQGTVWCYLMGAFADTAWYAGQGAKIPEMTAGLEKHMYEGGLATVSEICDGNLPHMFRGCFSQAWSVAELIRIRSRYCR